VLLNFEGEAEGMKTDQVILEVLKSIADAKIEKPAKGAHVGVA
jgi:hypothetical protein